MHEAVSVLWQRWLYCDNVFPLLCLCLYFVVCVKHVGNVGLPCLCQISSLINQWSVRTCETYEHTNIAFETFIHHSVFKAKMPEYHKWCNNVLIVAGPVEPQGFLFTKDPSYLNYELIHVHSVATLSLSFYLYKADIVQFMVTLSEMCKLNYMFIIDVIGWCCTGLHYIESCFCPSLTYTGVGQNIVCVKKKETS